MYLQTHLLAQVAREEPGRSTGSTTKALRQSFVDAIASLRPDPATAAGSAAWRHYQVLTLRYLEGLEISAVRAMLAVGRSEYFREQRRAVDAVVSLLRQRWDVTEGNDHRLRLGTLRLPAPLPRRRAAVGAQVRMPIPLTSFVGRERELAAVKALLGHARLVTLTGPPGVGKTRLAVAAAAEMRDAFDDDLCFVPLASISDPGLVISAVAQALAVPERAGVEIERSVQTHLRDRRLLLVADNFEQVLPAAPVLTELLATCPWLTVLVTSRTLLRVGGEQRYVVPPLALPGREHGVSLSSLAECAAVQLFLERTQAGNPDFALTEANAPAVVEICHRLDGLPLAIELAAAQGRLFSPQALLVRLDHRLPLLTHGARDLPGRQQSLRAAIDWSYHLCDTRTRRLFRQLAVFVGGCTLEAARAVCNLEHERRLEPFDGVAALVDHSLLCREDQPDGEPRFHLLESLREYALELLLTSKEADVTQRRHADYYLGLAEWSEATFDLSSARQQRHWLHRLEAEPDLETESGNLQAALQWALARGEVEQSLRLAGALAGFWLNHNRCAEGRRWLSRALALRGAGGQTTVRARALHRAGLLAVAEGDLRTGQTVLKESVAIWRQLDDQHGLALALAALGRVASKRREPAARPLIAESLALCRALGDQRRVAMRLIQLGLHATYEGDPVTACASLTESLTICRDLGDRVGMADATFQLGQLAMMQADYGAARAHFARSLATYRETGATHSIASVLNRQAELAAHDRDWEQALALGEESLTLSEELGDKDTMAWSLQDLGRVARHRGDERRATALFQGSLELRREQGHTSGAVVCLSELAEGAMWAGMPERATRLFSAAAALRDAAGVLPSPGDLGGYAQADVNGHVARLQAALGEATFSAAWAVGRAMGLEQAIAYALAADGGPTASRNQRAVQRRSCRRSRGSSLEEATNETTPPGQRYPRVP